MSDQKKSFLLYQDAAPVLRQLTAAQRGDLLLALYDYAERICQKDMPLVQAALDSGLDPAAQTAFLFMAAAIRRDTEKWRNRKASRQEARKGAPSADRQSGDPQDISWVKLYSNRLVDRKEATADGDGTVKTP